MTLVLAAVAAMLCKDMALVFQVQQRPVVMVTAQDDTTTLTAVTAVRTAIGIILHMAQVHGALAALSRAAIDLHVVYKVRFHKFLFGNGLQDLRTILAVVSVLLSVAIKYYQSQRRCLRKCDPIRLSR